MRLLYVTDRQVDAYLLKSLRQASHVVEPTTCPADGAEMAATGGVYDGVILDWSVLSAATCAEFAQAARGALIVMIAEPGDEAARTAVLHAGADACFVR